jgi:hypothetical protein
MSRRCGERLALRRSAALEVEVFPARRHNGAMTRSQIRSFVESSSVERVREVLDLLQKLKNRVPVSELPQNEVAFLLDLRDHEAFFRQLADEKLQK